MVNRQYRSTLGNDLTFAKVVKASILMYRTLNIKRKTVFQNGIERCEILRDLENAIPSEAVFEYYGNFSRIFHENLIFARRYKRERDVPSEKMGKPQKGPSRRNRWWRGGMRDVRYWNIEQELAGSCREGSEIFAWKNIFPLWSWFSPLCSALTAIRIGHADLSRYYRWMSETIFLSATQSKIHASLPVIRELSSIQGEFLLEIF